ncbi:hypothetical protein [Actinoalloteichus caeruleus]|uniref:hypothetical protein n=1 Tax=Actinoalloteichus cyanogriseus TaxID=2893586 RepID=UPI003AABA791
MRKIVAESRDRGRRWPVGLLGGVASWLAGCGYGSPVEGDVHIGGEGSRLCQSDVNGETFMTFSNGLENEGGRTVRVTGATLLNEENFTLVEVFLVPVPEPEESGAIVYVPDQGGANPLDEEVSDTFTENGQEAWAARVPVVGAEIEPGVEWTLATIAERTAEFASTDGVRLSYEDDWGRKYYSDSLFQVSMEPECS